MGTSTSSRATAASSSTSGSIKAISSSKEQQVGTGGRENLTKIEDVVCVRSDGEVEVSVLEGEEVVGDSFTLVDDEESETESETESESESESESEDEFDEDEDLCLRDARELKALALAYLHPETHVESGIGARCYFERYSAPEVEDEEDAAERAQILAEAAALKQSAVDFMHPEIRVVTSDPAACGRNYFERHGAVEQEDDEERCQVMADAMALKTLVKDYMNPEVGVTTSDPAVYGRNYFTRYVADEENDEENAAEHARILEDAAALKASAVDYMQPEVRVVTSDPMACGRNYFTRYTAEDEEDYEDAEERAYVLADAAALKKSAVQFMQPEVGVVTSDPAAYGRNYFERYTTEKEEDYEEAEAHACVLAEAAALKKLAVDYMHPEVGVVTSDSTAYGRNYFSRYSAEEQEEDEEERAQVLADASALKFLAVDYMQPERPVISDATTMGRNFYSRHAAVSEDDEKAQILTDALALKSMAVGYLQPEVGVVTSDAAAYGRNYFDRISAPEVEDEEDAEERARVLAEAEALKEVAVGYLCPEVVVMTSDAAACGRNYFTRVSAPEVEDEEDAEERARVLAEAAAMKISALDYMHPEVGVVSSDAAACGRNYFSRYSAEEQEEDEDAEERARVLAEASAMKKSAVDYMHPEVGVVTSDATSFGRNYFSRYSAKEQEDEEDAEERARVLAEAAAMKKSAVDYMHPEVGVLTSDATACGRNYFSRYSAEEQEEDEDAEERARVLAEASAMKKSAVDYMHPEVGVVPSDAAACGRNYFTRVSAPEVEDEDAEEHARVLAEATAMKKLAVDYMHPEVGVVSSDAAACGRNYFSRYSAEGQEEDEDAEERARVLAEASAMKKSAVDYMHPEVGVVPSDAASFGRNYFNRYATHDHHPISTVSTTPTRPERASSVASETFDFDDEVFSEMKEAFEDLTVSIPDKTGVKRPLIVNEEEEGNLSRSPSSVMLFGMEG